MIAERLLRQPVTIVTPGAPAGTDDYGNTTTGPPTSVDTTGLIEQTATTELIRGQQVTTVTYSLILRPRERISATSKVSSLGVTYEVVGHPLHAWDPRRNRVDHIEVVLKGVQP